MGFHLNRERAKIALSALKFQKENIVNINFHDEIQQINVISKYENIIKKISSQIDRACHWGLLASKGTPDYKDAIEHLQTESSKEELSLQDCELILFCLEKIHKDKERFDNKNDLNKSFLFWQNFANFIRQHKASNGNPHAILFTFEPCYFFKKVTQIKEWSDLKDVNAFLLKKNEYIHFVDLKPYTTHQGSTYYILVYQEYILD